MTVRYEAVNAMLLNEFLKEHRKNEEQQATIDRQQKQIERLTVTVGWNVFLATGVQPRPTRKFRHSIKRPVDNH